AKVSLNACVETANVNYHEPQTTNHKPQTTNHEPRTTNHEPQTTNHKPLSLILPVSRFTHYASGICQAGSPEPVYLGGF
ncbi:MAG TPA: hypothetical protein VJH03_26195, partial [Blastocatellia bacterium]|nr:hypothetical protein [Blastocatellia bacterium]